MNTQLHAGIEHSAILLPMNNSPPVQFPLSSPSLPSTRQSQQSQHQRLPSRSERHDHIVRAARDLYELNADLVDKENYRETVGDLVGVVDGMIIQLSRYDEMAAELKIAQSNLTLAERHSEFLEETLRRREIADTTTRHSTGTSGAASPEAPSWSKLETLVGLGVEDAALPPEPSSSRSFFARSLSRSRKQTISSSQQPTLRKQPSSRRLQVESTPNLHEWSPPLPSSVSSSPNLSSGHAVVTLLAEIAELRTTLAALTADCTLLRTENTKLGEETKTWEEKCLMLEKTKGELMDELEVVTEELFSEANAMVAGERKSRAWAEEEAQRARDELISLGQEVERLRSRLEECGQAPERHSTDDNSSFTSSSVDMAKSDSLGTSSSTSSSSVPSSSSPCDPPPQSLYLSPSTLSPSDSTTFTHLTPTILAAQTQASSPKKWLNSVEPAAPSTPNSPDLSSRSRGAPTLKLRPVQTLLDEAGSISKTPPSPSLEGLENLMQLLSSEDLFEDDEIVQERPLGTDSF